MYPATKANMQKLLRGNLVHRYTTTTDNPQQYLRNANAAVKQGTTDNRQVIRRSTKHRVWESVGRSVAVAAVVAAGGLTVVQQVSMFNSFMADGTLDASEIASLGFNALEGLSVPAAIRDVVHAATGDGPFVDDLITADNGVGPVEELVGGWGEGAVDFFRELFSS
ncbi:hypothetical protein HXX76_008092 [Chlamydomonas incerta]|uniref:Uncharacterized protein n=1 Tax=Chlamydomonas incerta TaxID=51695 RepID=A0A835SYD2_CHLIN|nr:hypothetical protein HXX76_008092 [Chlamydomonas incerta]|eukprot:KAG2433727.1 hypothetical protein HXX76_008092 [Chlamydomonas incerta]